jgi:putative transposase
LKLFSINNICKLCGISKNTYYSNRHPDERFEKKYQKLKNKIEKIIGKNCHYGVKRIKAALSEDYQIEVGRDALGRLLKLWHLGLKRKAKKGKKSIIKKILISLADRANLLIRTKIIEPFQAITTDITEIYYNGGKSKAYLSVHKDILGQMVYGWKLKMNMDADLVIGSLEHAKKTIKKLIKKIPEKMLCHQDQGSQYTSYEYVDRALKANMILSYSTPGTPTDNPGQESFFGRLKEECQADFNEIENFEKLEKFMKKRIKYYNNKRLHTSIGNQTPQKCTKNFIASNSWNWN